MLSVRAPDNVVRGGLDYREVFAPLCPRVSQFEQAVTLKSPPNESSLRVRESLARRQRSRIERQRLSEEIR